MSATLCSSFAVADRWNVAVSTSGAPVLTSSRGGETCHAIAYCGAFAADRVALLRRALAMKPGRPSSSTRQKSPDVPVSLNAAPLSAVPITGASLSAPP